MDASKSDLPAFFRKNELADRWRCQPDSIDKMVKDGTITPSRKLPGWKISREVVLKTEEVEFNPLSPFERRRLEQKIKELEGKVSSLQEIIGRWGEVSLEAMAKARGAELESKFKESNYP